MKTEEKYDIKHATKSTDNLIRETKHQYGHFLILLEINIRIINKLG